MGNICERLAVFISAWQSYNDTHYLECNFCHFSNEVNRLATGQIPHD